MTAASLELKVRPPTVALAIAALMWLASSEVRPMAVPASIRGSVALRFGEEFDACRHRVRRWT